MDWDEIELSEHPMVVRLLVVVEGWSGAKMESSSSGGPSFEAILENDPLKVEACHGL
ncbi:hypothetical protein TIFTF001_009875 [Ficus carica]|uniref:Uncharacterized protein n=1 Tax=Ficus carica TaxID=3494 RepID=A0AA88D2Y7_FICCA|nr:hypothetical protein TIFTF001_009875 [Ficus carica]